MKLKLSDLGDKSLDEISALVIDCATIELSAEEGRERIFRFLASYTSFVDSEKSLVDRLKFVLSALFSFPPFEFVGVWNKLHMVGYRENKINSAANSIIFVKGEFKPQVQQRK